MKDLLAAALAYAARRWPVFPLHNGPGCSCGRPCASPAKHPRTVHGLEDAITDLEVIGAWWQRWPAANIGIRTGVSFDVLDIDGAAGLDALAAFEEQGRRIPPGPITATGGGYHLFLSPGGLGNRAKFAPGLDWRGAGGYIVAPPSVHRTGQVYRWLPSGPDARLHPVPTWLREFLQARQVPDDLPASPGQRSSVARGTTPAGAAPGLVSPAYLRTVLERELEAVARASQGTRNDQLNRSCHAVFRFAELKAPAVADMFTTTALRAGLEPREIRRTILSAWTARP